MKFLILAIAFFLLGEIEAFTLSPFVQAGSGIFDAWNQSNPENVRNGGRFSVKYGQPGKIWVICHRLHRSGFSDPWDSAARGGIISTLQESNSQWTHKTYDRLDEDTRGDRLFSMKGRLFMMTYTTNQNKIIFHKLFFWDDDSGKWLPTPFEIDPTATTTSTNSIQGLAVNVPKQDENIAYVVASAHDRARGGGELAFSKLEVEFRGSTPIKASLKPLVHEQTRQPSAVVATALKKDKLYALVHHFYSEGYSPEFTFAYVLDLKTNRVGNVTLGGPMPSIDFSGDMHQTESEIFLPGGMQMYGLGQLRKVDDIYALNLNSFQWQKTPYKIPANYTKTAYDQQKKKLFLVGLKGGVLSASVTPS